MRRSLLLALTTAAAVAVTLGLLASGTKHGIRSAASRARRVAVDRPRPVLQRRTLPAADRLPGAVVSVAANPAIIRVPPSFLGVSTEYWAMPMFDRHMALFERVLTLLRVQGAGPFVLRIGGDSTDHALFDVNVRRLPKAVLELTPAWFQRASVLVRDISARVILDLNLVTDLPRMAARWAHAAQTELPRGSIVAYEIGNEPDLYDPEYWSEIFSPLEPVLGIRLLPVEPSAETYSRLYLSYARVLSRFAPGVPLAAPVLAYPGPHLNWIATLLADPHPGLGIVSAHEYPYSACAKPPVCQLADDRTDPQRARHRRHRAAAEARDPARAPGRPAVPAERAQLGHLRRSRRRQQHLRDRAVGAGRAVRAGPRRRRRGQRARSPVHGQRRLRAERDGHRAAAALVRPHPVHEDARPRSAAGRRAGESRTGRPSEGVGGTGRRRRPARAPGQQGRPAPQDRTAAPRNGGGNRAAAARPIGRRPTWRDARRPAPRSRLRLARTTRERDDRSRLR